MQNHEQLNITLPADMARMIRAKVEAGTYVSQSEVIREAVRLWQEREQRREERLEAIRAKIDEGDADPVSYTDEEIGRYFDERYQQSLKSRDGAA